MRKLANLFTLEHVFFLSMLATYDIDKSYDENYEHGPVFDGIIPKRKPGKPVSIFGFEVNSRLGVPAGPLLNAKYIKLYAELGFDLPVYKTVRTVARKVHPAPNCIFVDTKGQLTADKIGTGLTALEAIPAAVSEITITNSFGIPSAEPQEWQADIALANSFMKKGQVMIVSCVGTPTVGQDIADDYVRCAVMAKDAGAKIIELNYSCPNVCSKEGVIYQDAELSAEISKRVKRAIGTTPLMIKVGFFKNTEQLAATITANAPFVDGIAAINTISMNVYDTDGNQALPGEGRLKSGLCGAGIRNLSLDTVGRIATIRADNKFDFLLCGVGGITRPEDFEAYFALGADIAMSATGAMWNPLLAMEYHNR